MSLKDDLIHINNNKGIPSAYALSIKEFKDLTVKELAFIYFTIDHRSPFSIYEWDQRIIEKIVYLAKIKSGKLLKKYMQGVISMNN